MTYAPNYFYTIAVTYLEDWGSWHKWANSPDKIGWYKINPCLNANTGGSSTASGDDKPDHVEIVDIIIQRMRLTEKQYEVLKKRFQFNGTQEERAEILGISSRQFRRICNPLISRFTRALEIYSMQNGGLILNKQIAACG